MKAGGINLLRVFTGIRRFLVILTEAKFVGDLNRLYKKNVII